MGHDPDRIKECPECGSDKRNRISKEKVPGGLDWYEYECKECGNEWRT